MIREKNSHDAAIAIRYRGRPLIPEMYLLESIRRRLLLLKTKFESHSPKKNIFLIILATLMTLAWHPMVGAQGNFSVVSTITIQYEGSFLSFGMADFLGNGSNTLIAGGYRYPMVDQTLPFKAINISKSGVLSDVSATLFDGNPAQSWGRRGVVADFNGDGKPDFFSASHGYDGPPWPGDYQLLLLSQPNGKLKDVSTSLPPQRRLFVHSAAAADVKLNGRPEIFVGMFNSRQVDGLESFYAIPNAPQQNWIGPYFLRNDGTGNFIYDNRTVADKVSFVFDTSKNPWVAWDSPGTINCEAFADLNNDGYPDLILGGDSNNTYAGSVYFNDRFGGFRTTEYKLPPGLFGANNTITTDVLPMDVDSDGNIDLVLSQTSAAPVFYGGTKLQVLMNKGRGLFVDETATRIPSQTGAGRWVEFLRAIDLDGDGIKDIFLHEGYPEPGQIRAYHNDGKGVFSPLSSSYLPTGSNLQWLTPVDFDNDGKIDFLTLTHSQNSTTIQLYKNNGLQLNNHAQSGWWWNAKEPGRGYFIEIKGGKVFASSFLYDDSGYPTWYVTGPTNFNASGFSGTLNSFNNGQTLTGAYKLPAGPSSAGNINVTFADPTHGTINWPGGTVPITRYEISSGSLKASVPAFQPETGWWWNANEGGRGFAIEVQGNAIFVAGFMYDASGNPIWYVSGGSMANDSFYQGIWQQCANGQSITGAFKTATCTNLPTGSVSLRFTSTATALLKLPDGRQLSLSRYSF